MARDGVHCGGGEEWAWWHGFEMVSDWLIVGVFCFVCVCVYRRRIIKTNDFTHSLRKKLIHTPSFLNFLL